MEELLNKIEIQLEAKSYVNTEVRNSVSAKLEKRLKKLMSPNGGNRTRKNKK
jgi:hypothetical protein